MDHSVFVKQGAKGHLMVTMHVDDMAAAASNSEALALMIADLHLIIDIVDMGPIQWFLGMNIFRN